MSRFVMECGFTQGSDVILESFLDDFQKTASKKYAEYKEKFKNAIQRLIDMVYELYDKVATAYRTYNFNKQVIEIRSPVIDLKKYNLEKLLANTIALYGKRESIIKQMVPFVNSGQYEKCVPIFEKLIENGEEFKNLSDEYAGIDDVRFTDARGTIKMKGSEVVKLIEYWKSLLDKFNKNYDCFIISEPYTKFLYNNKNIVPLLSYLSVQNAEYRNPVRVFFGENAKNFSHRFIANLIMHIEYVIKGLDADIASYKEFGANIHK